MWTAPPVRTVLAACACDGSWSYFRVLIRWFLPCAGLVAVLLAAAGCGKRDTVAQDGHPSPATPQKFKILHVGNGTEPQDLDPHIVTGVPEHNIIVSLFEGLVSEDPVDLHIVPGVAERWNISEDGLVYTFSLRRNAKWSNGDPVTASDFYHSYRRMLTPELAAEYAYMLHHVVGAKDYNEGRLTDFSQVGFKVIDDRTFQFRLNNPTPFLLNALNHYAWYPVHIPTVEKHGTLARRGSRWTRPENFVGNGPFTLKEWRPNQKIIVEKSSTYWDSDTVRLDQIHFYAVESADTEERMFRTGQLHKAYQLPISKIDVYRAEHPEVLRIEPYYGTYFYRFNVTRPPLDDMRVRRALALAIDRESLVKNVIRGGQQPAYHFTPPSETFRSLARLIPDIAEARRLLAEAGYPNGRGLPSIELLYNTSESHRTIAEAIQQMWRRNLGVNVNLQNQEWKVYLDSQKTLSYSICRAGWIADYVDPHSFIDMWRTGGGNNDTGWSNAEYDRLLDESLQKRTDAERFAIYQRLEQILVQEMPVMPIYFYTRIYALNPKVKNHWPTLLDHHPWKYIDLEE